MEGKEIERKFLVNKFPRNNLVEEFFLVQGYISIDPEVKISKSITIGAGYKVTISNTLSFKSDGDLSRDEIKIHISDYHFNKLSDFIKGKFITKIGQANMIKDHHISSTVVFMNSKEILKCSEIEFSNITSAKKFKWPIKTIRANDVTYNPNYKMKNVWKKHCNSIENNCMYYGAFFHDLSKKIKKLSENRPTDSIYIKPILRDSINELIKQYKMYGMMLNKPERRD